MWTQTHSGGRQHEDTGLKWSPTGQGEGPGTDLSPNALRTNRPHCDLRPRASSTV